MIHWGNSPIHKMPKPIITNTMLPENETEAGSCVSPEGENIVVTTFR